MWFMSTENQIELMASMMYLLSLCVIAVIIPDVVPSQDSNVSSSGSIEQSLNQLMTVNYQLMMVNTQLMTANSQLTSAVSRLQDDVAELKSQQPLQQLKAELLNATSQLQKDVAELKDDQGLNQLKIISSQLINVTSQLQKDVAGLKGDQDLNKHMMMMHHKLMNASLVLQKGVAELKSGSRQKNATGTSTLCLKKRTSHFVIRCNFDKYWPILNILSLVHSVALLSTIQQIQLFLSHRPVHCLQRVQ